MWENIMYQQFQLVHFGRYTYLDTEEMAVFERRYFHELLAKQKMEEKEAHEKALMEMKNKSKTSKGR